MQNKRSIRQSQKPRPSGKKTFLARHMGIQPTTFYKYRVGIWPRPYDYDQRLAAAEAAWEAKQTASA